ncbi:hypothetical protein FE257_010845 [Aspergillus nanangensis]|uniref:Cytochrome P450 n=1 Tax=Aspergillus nanangensis TaxID=2582783 RepID=A0AAD4GZC4_ASPNN|nr:hypothetical protein FE257_010845 [Aspergillus nanangensis]
MQLYYIISLLGLTAVALAQSNDNPCKYSILLTLILSPLRHIPGSKTFALTKWRLGYEEYHGGRTRCVNRLHKRYGAVVRIGPSEVSFSSLSAQEKIYGPGSAFQKDRFYQVFDSYGRKVLASFPGRTDHNKRKRRLSKAYTKTAIMSPNNTDLIECNVRQFLKFIDNHTRSDHPIEIFSALLYFTLDSTSQFLYGSTSPARTAAMHGVPGHRQIVDDILSPSRRELLWLKMFLPNLSRWMLSPINPLRCVIGWSGILPPATATSTGTGIRKHNAQLIRHLKHPDAHSTRDSLVAQLLAQTKVTDSTSPPLDIMDITAECSDQLLAGTEVTSTALLWIIYHLSKPGNRIYQDKLRRTIQVLEPASSGGFITPATAGELQYLHAVITESLRLNPPSPGSQPRWSTNDEVIDGYVIPPGTVVSISPYTLHHQPLVFENPLRFDPERWLGDPSRVAEMERWFWPFSSGARMCLGMNLAVAEMKTLLANVYRVYRTVLPSGCGDVSPAMTHRGDVYHDEQCSRVQVHQCWVRFVRDDVV